MSKNEDWLRECLDNHYEEILQFHYLRTNQREDAEDLTQETFLAVVRSADTFQEQSSVRTWLFSIARNVLYTQYRKKYRIKNLLEKMKQTVKLRTHHSPSENETIFLMLDSLPKRDKDLIILKYYFGFRYEEIAEITGESTSNVGVRLSRSIAKVKEEERGGKANEGL